jgi:hypothetical protein
MTEEIYNILLPLKDKWETYKEHHYSEFTNIDYEIVKDAYAKLHGPPPRNLSCQSCIRELLRVVFLPFDNFKPEIKQNAKVKTFRKRR